jgi:hypothetical protein
MVVMLPGGCVKPSREAYIYPPFDRMATSSIVFLWGKALHILPTVLPMLGSLFDNLEKWRKEYFYITMLRTYTIWIIHLLVMH